MEGGWRPAGTNGETLRPSWAKGTPTSPRGVVRVGGQEYGQAAGSPDSVSRALNRAKFIAKRHRVRMLMRPLIRRSVWLYLMFLAADVGQCFFR